MMWRIKQAFHRKKSSSSKSSNESRRKSVSFASPLPSFRSTAISTSAAETVLKTPELVEMILVHLDLNQLLFAQRVCRHWKEITRDSQKLKRALYLSPITKIDERIPIDNAWLKSRFPDLGVYLLQGNPKWRPKYVQALTTSDFERLGQKFFSENASWRNMLLTQPPITDAVVYASIEELPRRSSSLSKRDSTPETDESTFPKRPSVNEWVQASVVVKSATGVTMGMVVEAGIEAQRRGFVIARKRLSERKDSGYVSMGSESGLDEIEVAVVEVEE